MADSVLAKLRRALLGGVSTTGAFHRFWWFITLEVAIVAQEQQALKAVCLSEHTCRDAAAFVAELIGQSTHEVRNVAADQAIVARLVDVLSSEPCEGVELRPRVPSPMRQRHLEPGPCVQKSIRQLVLAILFHVNLPAQRIGVERHARWRAPCAARGVTTECDRSNGMLGLFIQVAAEA
jgi:hypothetical protein